MTPQRTRTALSATLLVWLAGCASSPPAPTPPPPRAISALLPSRIDAVAGRTLVLPLSGDTLPAATPARLADARELPTRVRWLSARPVAGQHHAWLGPTMQWTSGTGPTILPTPIGGWCLLVDIPADAAGPMLSLQGRDLPVQFLSAQPRTANPRTTDPWEPARAAALPTDFALSPRVTAESRDPRTRWRWRLLTDGLRPDTDPAAVTAPPLDDPDAEALALQQEARWRVALGMLWAADPELAGRVKRSLAAVVDFGNSQWAPAWSTDLTDLEDFLGSLLDPALTPHRRAVVAERWLARQPAAFAWIDDDGSVLDESRTRVIAGVQVASVLDRATLAWAAAEPEPREPDLHELASFATIRLAVAPQVDPATGTGPIFVHAGRWSQSLTSIARPLPITPPGARLGPFVAETTMQAWHEGVPTEAAWTTAGLLHRPAMPPGAEPSASRSRPWELYIECRTARGVDARAEELRVYLGPPERPAAAVRISENGDSAFLPLLDRAAATDELLPPATGALVQRSADRWTVRLPLPPGSVDKDGLVRLGIVRTDALGRRSSWPRPMLPWQALPARAALDTRSWITPGAPPEAAGEPSAPKPDPGR